MPTVPRYGQQKVSPAPMPSPSGGGGGGSAVSAAALGAGYEESKIRRFNLLSDIGSNVATEGFGLLRNIKQEQEQARTQANQYALLKADNQLSLWENAKLYDVKDGVFAQRGEAAFPLPELVQKEYNDLTGEISKGLGNDEQRLAFETIRLQRWQQLDHTVRSHVLGQMQEARGKELEAFVENTQSRAIHFADEPRVVAEELGKVTTALNTHGPELGMGREQIDREIGKARTAIHVGVIGTLIDQQHVGAAQAYYDETKDQIDGDAIGRIEKALNEGTVAHQAQVYADGIGEWDKSLSEQIQLLHDNVKDPAVRQAAQGLIEHAYAVHEKDQADQAEARLKGIYDQVEQTHDFNSIPVAVRSTLTGGERSAIRGYIDHLTAGTDVETNLETYYRLMTKAGASPQTFARENLLAYRDQLGKVEFKQLTEMQVNIRNNKPEKDQAALAGFRTRSQIVDDTLVLYGIDPNAKSGTPQAKAIASLRGMLDQRVDAAQLPDASGKRKAVTNEEIQQTLHTLLGQKVDVPGSWWNIWPGGKAGPWGVDTKRVIDLTIDDVPAATRTDIAARLKARGLPDTDEVILSIFRESLVK